MIGLFPVCQSHRRFGEIYHSRREEAVYHFWIVSAFEWHYELFLIHCHFALLWLDELRLPGPAICEEKYHAADDA